MGESFLQRVSSWVTGLFSGPKDEAAALRDAESAHAQAGKEYFSGTGPDGDAGRKLYETSEALANARVKYQQRLLQQKTDELEAALLDAKLDTAASPPLIDTKTTTEASVDPIAELSAKMKQAEIDFESARRKLHPEATSLNDAQQPAPTAAAATEGDSEFVDFAGRPMPTPASPPSMDPHTSAQSSTPTTSAPPSPTSRPAPSSSSAPHESPAPHASPASASGPRSDASAAPSGVPETDPHAPASHSGVPGLDHVAWNQGAMPTAGEGTPSANEALTGAIEELSALQQMPGGASVAQDPGGMALHSSPRAAEVPPMAESTHSEALLAEAPESDGVDEKLPQPDDLA